MVGRMFATQNKLGYWSVTRPFLLAKGHAATPDYTHVCTHTHARTHTQSQVKSVLHDLYIKHFKKMNSYVGMAMVVHLIFY